MRTHHPIFASLALSIALLAGCGGNAPPEAAEPVGSQTEVQRVAPEADEQASGERSCGGFTLPGTPGCTESEFCDFPLDAHCGAADAPGVCRPRPEMCTLEHRPVCGCDGRTYPNRCDANRAGTGVAAEEPCAEAAAAP